MRVTSPALETIYHLQVLLNGNCLWRGRQREHYLVPGELLLINPDDPVDLTYSEDCEKFILKVPVRLLESICDEQRWQRPSGGVRFLRNHYRLDELDGFLGLLGMVCNEAEVSDSLPRVQGHYSQIVASKLLTLMSTNVRRESLGGAGLERILGYIEDNLKFELSAETLAEQANLSLRSLYGLFDRRGDHTQAVHSPAQAGAGEGVPGRCQLRRAQCHRAGTGLWLPAPGAVLGELSAAIW